MIRVPGAYHVVILGLGPRVSVSLGISGGDSSAFSSNEMALSGLPSQDCSLERPNRVRSLEFSALPALVQRKEKD